MPPWPRTSARLDAGPPMARSDEVTLIAGRRAGERSGRGRGTGLILLPEHPREEHGAAAHRHVRHVERRPPRIAESDVDEVHHAEIRTQPIEQIADRAATHDGERAHGGRGAAP